MSLCISSNIALSDFDSGSIALSIRFPMKKRSATAAIPTSSFTLSNSSSESSSLTSIESNPKRIKKPKTKKLSTPATPPTRTSVYRGVTRHRWTGRFEAHLWDKETWNSVQTKKGRQVYLGAYDTEEAAATTYDLAAIKYWGPDTALNFQIEMYEKEIEEMQKLTREEYLATLRRRSSGFSRGVSKFRGVAKHHHNGRWEARIGRVLGNKYLYLGTYSTQEEAAAAYDRAAIQYRGANAVTNFDISNYAELLSKKNPMDDEEQVMNEQPQQLVETDHAQDQENETGNAQDSCTMEDLLGEDHGMMKEYDLSWYLNMETDFNELPITNISDVITNSSELHCELPVFFDDYIGFEDDLDFMFSSELVENTMFDLGNEDKGDNSTTTILPTMTPSSSYSSLTSLSTSPTPLTEASYEDYLV